MIITENDLDFKHLLEDSIETIIEKAYIAFIQDKTDGYPLEQDPFLALDDAIFETTETSAATALPPTEPKRPPLSYAHRPKKSVQHTQKHPPSKKKSAHVNAASEEQTLIVKHPRLTPSCVDPLGYQEIAQHIPIPEAVFTRLKHLPVKLHALNEIIQSEKYAALIAQGFSLHMLITILSQQAGARSLRALVQLYETEQLPLCYAFGFNNDQLCRILAQPLGFKNLQLLQRIIKEQNRRNIPAFNNILPAGISTEDITKMLAQPLGYKNVKKLIASWSVGISELGSWYDLQTAGYSTAQLLHTLSQPMGFDIFNRLVLSFYTTQIAEDPEWNRSINNLFSTSSMDNTLPPPDLLLPKTFEEIPPSIIQALETYPKKLDTLKKFYASAKWHDYVNSPIQLKTILMILHPMGGSSKLTFLHGLATHHIQGQPTPLQQLHRQGFTLDTITHALLCRGGTKHIHAWLSFIQFSQEDPLKNPSSIFIFIDKILTREPKNSKFYANIAPLYLLFCNNLSTRLFEEYLNHDWFITPLLAHPEFINTFLTIRSSDDPHTTNTNIPYLLTINSEASIIFEIIYHHSEFQNTLQDPAFFKRFFEVLLIKPPASSNNGANESAFYQLFNNEHGQTILRDILEKDLFLEQLEDPAFFMLFFETLLARKPDPETADYNLSALYCLIEYLHDDRSIQNTLGNDLFNEKLKDPAFFMLFFETLLARLPRAANEYCNDSVLLALANESIGIKILHNILTSDLFKEKLEDPVFFTLFFETLLARRSDEARHLSNLSALYLLSLTTDGIHILEGIGETAAFLTAINNPTFLHGFLDALLARRSDEAENFSNLSPLHLLMSTPKKTHSNLLKILTTPAFITSFVEHPEFFTTLFVKIDSEHLCYQNSSCFFYMVNKLHRYYDWLSVILSHQTFLNWISNTENLASMMETIFAEYFDGQSIFSNLFSTGSREKALLIQLMHHTPIQQAFFETCNIPHTMRSFWMSQFNTHTGFSIWHTLIALKRMPLLAYSSLQAIFQNPQIQQLIHMQQIKPEWFLFMAVNQSQYDSALIQFFLDQENITVLANNDGGRLLNHLVDDLVIPDIHKMDLKARLHRTLQQQTERHARRNICVQLLDAPSLQTEQATSTDFVLPGNSPLETTGIEQVQAYIQWIMTQQELSMYHAAFDELSKNTAIVNLPDYTQLSALLKEICIAMQDAIEHNKPMTFHVDWKGALGLCIIGIMDCLHQMKASLLGIHPFKSYFENAIKTHAGYYNQLFITANNLEIHAPQALTHSYLGRSLPNFPIYDAYLLSWSPIQQHWVAQNAAARLLHSEEYLYEHIVQPFLDTVANTLWITDQHGERQAVTEIDISLLNQEHPLCIACEWLNTTLLHNNPFDMQAFMSFIFANETLSQAMIEEIVNAAGTITDIHSQAIQEKLQLNMQNLFSQWLAEPAQVGIPQRTTVNACSSVLWQYLTNDTITPETTCFINKLPHATDAPALIQYCLNTHADQTSQIHWDRFLKPLSDNSTTTLLSLIIANPFYTEWFFGFKIKSTVYETPHEHQPFVFELQLYSTQDAPGFAHLFMDNPHLKTLRDNALEAALIQPGTLFFWLYYFHANPIYHDVLFVIIQFIFSTPKGLAEYDSLLPLLLAIQLSSTPTKDQKWLVRHFLKTHIKKQLQEKHEAYWQTSCFLIRDPITMAERAQNHTEDYPWLLSQQHHAITDMARCFLHNVTIPEENVPLDISGRHAFFRPAIAIESTESQDAASIEPTEQHPAPSSPAFM